MLYTFFFHSLILVRPTWPYSALLRARIMQQNREDFQEWYDKSVLHLDIEKVRHTEARSYTSIALAQRWPVMTNLLRTALNVAFTDIFFFFFLHWHSNSNLPKLMFSWLGERAGKFAFCFVHLIFASLLSPATAARKHPRAWHSLQNTLAVFTPRLNPQQCWFAQCSWSWVIWRQLRRDRKWEVYEGICCKKALTWRVFNWALSTSTYQGTND